MKKLAFALFLSALMLNFAVVSFAQNNTAKDELFSKIVKLSQTKKPADQEKAYQNGVDFLKKFGQDSDEKVKKIKDFVGNYRNNLFNQKLNDNKTAEAYALGKEILAQEPENTYVTMNLAYAGYEASNKNKDNSYGKDSVNYAEQTLKSFDAGKVPATFEPFKDKAEATALMYYVIANFNIDSNLKLAAENYYKSVQIDSKIKTTAYPYYIIAFYYEKEYEKAVKDFQTKHGAKVTEDAAMKADGAKLEKILDRMLDAYARAIKYAAADDAGKDDWKKRFTDVYKFAKEGDAGMDEYLNNAANAPLPDPNTL